MCARYYPRRGGAIPPALSQGKNVFPMVPMRNFLSIPLTTETSLTSANNDGEVVDLDLQFEDNEVMDLWQIDLYLELEPEDNVFTLDLVRLAVALFEDPDKADNTDIQPTDGSQTGAAANTIENDSSLVKYFQHAWSIREGATITDVQGHLTERMQFVFPQPYTVARNVKWIMQANAILTASDFDAINCYAELWGRRRNAAQDEFINIVYRQRF